MQGSPAVDETGTEKVCSEKSGYLKSHERHSASAGLPDSAAAEDLAKMALRSFMIPNCKHKNVFTENPAKCDEKTRVCCLVRRMGPVKFEHYSILVLLLYNCAGHGRSFWLKLRSVQCQL
ncbi:hypothetical protein ACTXT7_009539 [Hymenolepis weldensis]